MSSFSRQLFGLFNLKISRINQKVKSPYFIQTESGFDYFKTPIGNYYLPVGAENDIVGKSMKFGNVFDKFVVDVARRFVKPASTVLDVGSNFGQMALEFSKLGDDVKVYAFEAEPFVYAVLEKNIAANNKAHRIIPVKGAVYNELDKELIFPYHDLEKLATYGSYGIDPTATEGNIVKTITIDSLQIAEPISFMKIDIQGSDLFALEGAYETIMKHRMPIIFEFEEDLQSKFNTSFQGYVDFVAKINYRFAEVLPYNNYLILPK